MGFPFLNQLNSYVKPELTAKLDPVKFSLLKPWISVTSNLGPNGYTLKTDSYPDIFGINGKYESNQSSVSAFKPRPIITGFSIDFASRGVTKTGTISFSCFNLAQFEEIQKYFLEPGISVFVQWGWNKSSINNKTIFAKPTDAKTQLLYYRTNETLNKDREAANGCYDNFMGIINGGKSSISNNSYQVECKLIAIGEVLMGASIADPAIPKCENQTIPSVPAYTSTQLGPAREDKKRHKYHWMAFFNSLPDGIKNIKDLKAWGETSTSIDPRVDFINYDEEAMADAKDEADGAIIFTDGFYVAGKKIKGTDSDIGSPIYDGKYIRFKAMVAIINYIHAIKQGIDTKGKDVGSLGIDLSEAYCGATPGIYSSDPSCFIPNKSSVNFMELNGFFKNLESSDYKKEEPLDNSVKGIGDITVSFPIEKDTTTKWEGKDRILKAGTAGKIENLYINHDLAIQCITTAFNNSIKECLDDMMKSIEKASLGLWDFQVIKPEGNDNLKITIIDCNMTSPEVSAGDKPIPTSFSLFGKECVFLEFEFDSNIGKGMMNKVVMDKSSPGSTDNKSTDKGRTLFSNQKDIVITDTVKGMPVDPCAPPDARSNSTSGKSQKDKQADFDGFVKTTKILLQPKYSKSINPLQERGLFIPGISTNAEAELEKMQGNGEEASKPPRIGSPINSTIKFKILGNSGFKVGDLITVTNMPKSYEYNPSAGDTGAFMVLKLSHTVEDKGWYTNIEAMFRPY